MKINTNKLATEIVENIQEFQKENAEYKEYSEQEREKIRETQKEKLISLVESILVINFAIGSMNFTIERALKDGEEKGTTTYTKKDIALIMESLTKN